MLFSVCVCYRLCVANSFVDREMIAYMYLKIKRFKGQIEKLCYLKCVQVNP